MKTIHLRVVVLEDQPPVIELSLDGEKSSAPVALLVGGERPFMLPPAANSSTALLQFASMAGAMQTQLYEATFSLIGAAFNQLQQEHGTAESQVVLPDGSSDTNTAT